jgi:hypothetical protein
MSQLAVYKSRSLAAIKENRQSVRKMVDGIEIIAGATIGGFISTKMPEVGGVPTDAAAGLVLVGVGFGMKQPDVTALGVGMLAGYAHQFGAGLGT